LGAEEREARDVAPGAGVVNWLARWWSPQPHPMRFHRRR